MSQIETKKKSMVWIIIVIVVVSGLGIGLLVFFNPSSTLHKDEKSDKLAPPEDPPLPNEANFNILRIVDRSGLSSHVGGSPFVISVDVNNDGETMATAVRVELNFNNYIGVTSNSSAIQVLNAGQIKNFNFLITPELSIISGTLTINAIVTGFDYVTTRLRTAHTTSENARDIVLIAYVDPKVVRMDETTVFRPFTMAEENGKVLYMLSSDAGALSIYSCNNNTYTALDYNFKFKPLLTETQIASWLGVPSLYDYNGIPNIFYGLNPGKTRFNVIAKVRASFAGNNIGGSVWRLFAEYADIRPTLSCVKSLLTGLSLQFEIPVWAIQPGTVLP